MRHFRFLLPALLAAVSFFWTACFKDHFTGADRELPVTFAGQVLDEYGQALAGAFVESGGIQMVTDRNGVFRFPIMSLPANNAILKVSKAGYFDFSRAYVLEANSIKPVTVQLLRKTLIGSFDASTGGTLQMQSGASLTFPAGAVAHTGIVSVFAHYLDPTDVRLGLQMPGDLRAINVAGEEQVLATFGMIGVELVGQSTAQVLQLAAGKEAELKMPIQPTQSATAPNQIALWHYDHDQARWLEEGSAQRVGNHYVGKVKHFSFWNCDAPFPLIYLKGRVVDNQKGRPVGDATIRITILGSSICGMGNTNAEGIFAGNMPKGEKLKLEVLAPFPCVNEVIYTDEIGPFNTDAVLPDIQVALSSKLHSLSIKGVLSNCAGQSVSRGYVIANQNGADRVAFSDANGVFDFSWVSCLSSSSCLARGYDLDTGKESNAKSLQFPPFDVDLGNITICNALQEFIKYQVDGTDYLVIHPFAETFGTSILLGGQSASLADGISMQFQNAGSTGTFPLTQFSLYGTQIDSLSTHNVTTTLTQFAAQPDDVHVGTFGGGFKDVQGKSHTISGSYQVKR